MILPTERRKIEKHNPKLIVLYGKPKSGKSSIMAALDNNLIMDLEDGYRALSVMSIDLKKVADFFEAEKALKEKMAADGKKPYKYITIDNATRLEEMSISYANHLYRTTTPMGASWGLKKDSKGNSVPDPSADVRLLPNGAGWLYVRKAVRKLVELFVPYCETLILVAHVKDKQIRKDGEEMSEMSVDLAKFYWSAA